MSALRLVLAKELRIAETVVALVEARVRERFGQCPYRDDGAKAYASAEAAIDAGIKDARNALKHVVGV